ncbi:MAG: sigma-70 family RNA polymerase sigma factor [Clostridia bacterium]|nr:sigma-70 family RNA polymerase sigma factor [Clostridia bacterium]
MPKNQLEQETEYVFSLALSKCGDVSDAQDLTQETLLSALVYLEKGGYIENPRTFLSTLLNRKYYDMLRRKYRTPTVTIGEDFDIADDTDFTEELIRREEAENIRREVAYLATSYRAVIVKHYFHNKTVKDIAAELDLPVGTVKSRLDFGRKQMKKGIENMEKYEESSYMPKYLAVRNSGRFGEDGEPMSLTENDPLAQNLLILAYEKPITISDLSKAIGVAAAYVEPIINKLVDGELMKRMGDGKVYTDFIIYDADDNIKYIDEAEAFVEKHSEAYINPVKTAIEELKQTSFYSKRLERFMLIEIASNGTYRSMESLRDKPQIFPERPNGGQWIAFATVYRNKEQMNEPLKAGKENYTLAGRRNTEMSRYLQAENLTIHNYESSLYSPGWNKYKDLGFKLFQDAEFNLLRLLYLIHKKINPEDVALDYRMIKAIPLLEERGFITTKNGSPEILVPVLTHEEEKQFFSICSKASAAFAENIREPLAAWCRTHIKEIPPHLTSVPDQKRTLPYEPASMMFVYEAIRQDIHPRDLGYICPETFVVFD